MRREKEAKGVEPGDEGWESGAVVVMVVDGEEARNAMPKPVHGQGIPWLGH